MTSVRIPTPNGKIMEVGTAGTFMLKARAVYQALAELCVTFDLTEEFSNELVPWPIKKNVDNEDAKNSPIEAGTMMRPKVHIRRKWFDEVSEGLANIPEHMRKATEKRFERLLKMREVMTVQGAAAAARHLQQKVLNNELDVNQTVLYKYTHDGFGFTRTSTRETSTQQTTNIGQLQINAGQKPSKLITVNDVKRIAAGKATNKAIKAEFRVVEGAEAPSSPS